MGASTSSRFGSSRKISLPLQAQTPSERAARVSLVFLLVAGARQGEGRSSEGRSRRRGLGTDLRKMNNACSSVRRPSL